MNEPVSAAWVRIVGKGGNYHGLQVSNIVFTLHGVVKVNSEHGIQLIGQREQVRSKTAIYATIKSEGSSITFVSILMLAKVLTIMQSCLNEEYNFT